jgi:hypothetical protein
MHFRSYPLYLSSMQFANGQGPRLAIQSEISPGRMQITSRRFKGPRHPVEPRGLSNCRSQTAGKAGDQVPDARTAWRKISVEVEPPLSLPS